MCLTAGMLLDVSTRFSTYISTSVTGQPSLISDLEEIPESFRAQWFAQVLFIQKLYEGLLWIPLGI